MKRFLKAASVAALVLIMAFLCAVALPTQAEAATSGKLTYEIENGEAIITDCDSAITGTLTIPAQLGGYTVTTIDSYAFSNCNDLAGVVIPAGVKVIGNSAFYSCDSLASVTISNTVTTIEDWAFASCPCLINITIPANVTLIENYAFDYCKSLKKITVNSANPYYSSDSKGVLFDKNKTALIKAPGALSGSYTIPSTTKSVLKSAFSYCKELTQVVIPASVVSIENYAFQDCVKLSKVTLNVGLQLIGTSAFSGCGSLTGITIPKTVTEIGKSAFFYCTKMNKITVNQENAVYSSDGAGVLYNKDKTALIQAPGAIAGSYTIPSTVKTVGYGAFSYCKSLIAVTIPSGVTTLENYAFENCDSLSKVTVPATVTSIGSSVFGYCGGLISVTISNGVPEIGEYMFTCCPGLTGIKLPNSIKTIGSNAFNYCKNLTGITLPSGVTTIGSGAFYDCRSLTNVTIPASVASIGRNAFKECGVLSNVYYTGNKTQWQAITMDEGNDCLKNASVKVNSIITSQPISTVAGVGGKAKFSVTAKGSGLKYQWQYRASATAKWTNATGTGNKTANLTVSATAARNGYQYRCVITSGSTKHYSASATLFAVQPKIVYNCYDVTVAEGEVAKFSVTAEGVGLTYQWQYLSSAKVWTNATASGNKTPNLLITTARKHNGLQYRCKITDLYGKTIYSRVVTLKVTVLMIQSQPSNFYARAGSTAKFSVVASGNGLKYQWQYKTSSGGKWQAATVSGNKTANLTVPATMARNGFYYRCKVSDSKGNVLYTKEAKLTVAVLKINTQPVNRKLAVGKTAVFTVKATGTNLKYQWQYRTPNGTWKNASATGNKTATLKVPVTAAKNGYQYRCMITDKYYNYIYSSVVKLTVTK